MVSSAAYPSPLGLVEIGYEDDAVVFIRCNGDFQKDSIPSRVSDLASTQLQEYFSGKRKDFDFPIRLHGTAFQIKVWQVLAAIPYGQTRTYGEIAAAIGAPNASRAVGMACNRNPLWIAIPCHRVVGKDQKLTGYAGGIAMKQALLKLEQR